MRPTIRSLCLMLLGVATAPDGAHAQAVSQLRHEDRVRLAEARRLADQLADSIWPGWGHTPFQILLVADSAEFLVGHRPPSGGFASLGRDPVLGAEVWTRTRRFPPTLLATFPAVDGRPTVVIGSAERTGKSSTPWVLTLLHEHFHQWQYSQADYYDGVARLDLAHGDTTGQWMLSYPFPYDSAPVQRAMRGLAAALDGALKAAPTARAQALGQVIAARDTLRGRLSAADYRYLEFQLWQEGVARFIEYDAARAAAKAGAPSTAFRGLPDFMPYDRAGDSALAALRRELRQLDPARQRRVAFYPLGAAMALLLEDTRSDWKQAYTSRPFALAALLPAGR